MFVDNGPIKYGEPVALSMNKHTFEQISKQGISNQQYQAANNWLIFLNNCLKESKVKNLTVAGKNVAGFDIPILRNNGFKTDNFSHRVLDIGSLYLTDFGYIPNLNKVNELLGREPVSHDALTDCEDIVAAIEYKMKQNERLK